MQEDIKAQLRQKRDELVSKLKKEQIAWNEYLRGEGILAGHEHSLHESQDTKFKLIEAKIHAIDELLNRRIETLEVDAEIDGVSRRFRISNNMADASDDHISINSPIGKALVDMKKGEQRKIATPGGAVMLKKVS